MRNFFVSSYAVIGVAGSLLLSGCQRKTTPEIAKPESANSEIASRAINTPSPTVLADVENHNDEKHDDHDEGPHQHFMAEGARVTDHGIPLLLESQTAGGFSPERRAQLVAERLNVIATTHGLEAEEIFMRPVNGSPTVFFFHEHGAGNTGHVLATIDPLTAKQFGFAAKPELLAYWWRDLLRDHALIVEGNPPRWTTRYAQPIQQLYNLTQKEQRGVPSHESFEQALAKLTPPERDILTNLYASVPSNYRPIPDDMNQARKAEAASEGKEHHEEKEDEKGHHHE